MYVRMSNPTQLSPDARFMSDGASSRRKRPSSVLSVRSVVGQMFVLQIAVVVLLAVGAVLMLALTTQSLSTRAADNQSLAVAQGFASSQGSRGS